MREPAPAASLELDQDHDANRNEWRFERAGWCLLALLVLLGVSGLFGSGPLAHAEARSADGRAIVRYERFVRVGAANMLSVIIAATEPGDTVAVISLDRHFMERAGVERVTPEPAETRGSTDRVEYTFHRPPDQRSFQVDFTFQPTAVGHHLVTLLTAPGRFDLRQFALP